MSNDALEAVGGFWTAKEIQQQPASWLRTQTIIDLNISDIRDFLSPILAIDDLRIILTGAGTSAFAGACLAPILHSRLSKYIDAIATTDLVSNPQNYFHADVPTLVVSFARSGNSPESVAAVVMASKRIKTCYHLAVTCNEEGQLHQSSLSNKNFFSLLMPEETHDRSFAMTSSFSSMMYSARQVLLAASEPASNAQTISDLAQSVIEKYNTTLKAAADNKYSRVVYLGSGGLKALAQESALKLLELTDGKVVAFYDSPLGFRHGPKAVADENTLVVVFMSNDPYTRQYDLDLLAEIRRDKEVGQVLAISGIDDDSLLGDALHIENAEHVDDSLMLFPYIVCAQIYAFHSALAFGNTPDTPSASGTINRVVQGVTIYSLRD